MPGLPGSLGATAALGARRDLPVLLHQPSAPGAADCPALVSCQPWDSSRDKLALADARPVHYEGPIRRFNYPSVGKVHRNLPCCTWNLPLQSPPCQRSPREPACCSLFCGFDCNLVRPEASLPSPFLTGSIFLNVSLFSLSLASPFLTASLAHNWT